MMEFCRKIAGFFKKIWHKIKSIFRKKEKPEKVNLVYPITWETMDFEDFRSVCEILKTPRSRQEILFLAFCRLAHIRPDDPAKYDPKKLRGAMPFIINGKSYIVTANVLREGTKQISFILDSIGLPPSPFKEIDRKLNGISFKQFFTADSYLMRYQTEKNGAYLKVAIKTLSSGRRRRLLGWESTAFIIWWNGIKQYLKKRYPYVFSSEGDISNRTQAEILQDLLSTMNDNKPQANEDILRCDVHSVLFSLNKIYEDAKKRAAQR